MAAAGPVSDNGAGRRRSILGWFLDSIEAAGNRLPDPATIFAGLAALVLVASWIAAKSGLSVIHPVTKAPIAAVNLLNADGLRRIFTTVVTNFTSFAPLGTVLTAMIGIGVAERAGLFGSLLKAIVSAVPRWAVTPTVIFAGFLSHTASDAGYVILIPLAPIVYVSVGRHPLAGITAAFAGIGGGFSANVLLSALDPMLAGLTQEAARLYDPTYQVLATANYYFLSASVFLLTGVGTWVSVKLVEPRFGAWEGPATEGAHRLEAAERRGLVAALIAFVVTAAAITALVAPRGALLRDPATGGLKPFYDSLVGLLLVMFLIPGLAYGIATGQIRRDRDASRMMAETMSAMGTYIVLAFFAGQFIEYFKWSNLGAIIAVEGAQLLKSVRLTGPFLLIAFVMLTATINLVMASASAKWAIMSLVFVPMFMNLGYSPETTQAFYRVGASVTNVITPLNYYFPIIIAVAQRYVPRVGLGTLISAMLPYSIAFGLAWTAMTLAWYYAGLPMGPGAPLTYHAG